MPTPSSVIIAEVAGGTLNSSAANFRTAVNGVFSGTLNLQKNPTNQPNKKKTKTVNFILNQS